MQKRGTRIGDASPIRKSYIAFHLAKVMNDIVVRAMEERLDPGIANGIMFQFGKYLSESTMALPERKFALSEGFYATEPIVATIGEMSNEYDSIGTYAESIYKDEDDACDSKTELKSICYCLAKAFADNGIEGAPSKDELLTVCLDDADNPIIQRSLTRAFSQSIEKSVFDKVLFDAMSAYHVDYTGRFLKWYGDDIAEEQYLDRIYEMLPFSMAPASTVASVYEAFLPILLYADIRPINQTFCTYRIECGRQTLRQFTDGAMITASEESWETLDKYLGERAEKLVPYLPKSMLKFAKEKPNSSTIAFATLGNLYLVKPSDGFNGDVRKVAAAIADVK